MSHFSVMVIGDDPEGQLAPYDENIKTAPTLQGLVPQEELDSFLKWVKEDYPDDSDGSFEYLYKKYGGQWNGSAWAQNKKGEWEVWSTYNPSSKWDWYQLGGRWTGWLKLKEGVTSGIHGKPGLMTERAEEGTADQAEYQDIDWEGMRAEAKMKAAKEWKRVNDVISKKPKAKSWEEILTEFGVTSEDRSRIGEVREAYSKQPRVKAFRKLVNPFEELEEYEVPANEYVKLAGLKATCPFAVVKAGRWYEKAEMGWFAMTSNDKSEAAWAEEVANLLADCQPDTLVSVYDCHI